MLQIFHAAAHMFAKAQQHKRVQIMVVKALEEESAPVEILEVCGPAGGMQVIGNLAIQPSSGNERWEEPSTKGWHKQSSVVKFYCHSLLTAQKSVPTR